MPDYKIACEICGVFVSAATLFILYTQYERTTKKTRLFHVFMWAVLIASFLDAMAGFGLNQINRWPLATNITLNTLYFSAAPLCVYLCIEYFFKDLPKLPKLWRPFNIICTIFYEVIVLINIPTGILFSIDMVSGYHHGHLYLLSVILIVYFVINIPVITFLNWKSIKVKERASYIGFFFLCAVGYLVQQFACPNILMTYFFIAVGGMVIMWTLETPDFKELNRLQKHLEQEVEEQTQIATFRQQKIEKMSLQVIQALVHSIDAKDEYTNGHATRVSEYSELLARALGWNEEQVEELKRAALLHDIGKIGIPDAILNKPGRLTQEEFSVMQQHTLIGADIMANVTTVPYGMEVARYHHERYDGSGYPEGRSGASIPETARLVCIADAYDAMSSCRVYRKNLSKEEIRGELLRGRGTQFDPDMLDVFLNLIDTDRLHIAHPHILPQWILGSTGTQGDVDTLTGLLRRESAVGLIKEAILRGPGALICVDMDNLRILNNLHGFVSGDTALTLIARIMKNSLPNAIIGRFGGDEFICYLQGADGDKAYTLMQNVLRDFKEQRPDTAKCVTISAGITEVLSGETYDNVYPRADKALYYVKRTGKSNAYIYGQTSSTDQDTQNNVDLDQLIIQLSNSSTPGAMRIEDEHLNHTLEHMLNMNKRYKQRFSVVMISLREESDNYLDEIDQAMVCMEHAIQADIRNVDIFTRYSNMQFLVFLQDVDEETTRRIVARIFKKFYSESGTKGIIPSYSLHVVDVKKEPL